MTEPTPIVYVPPQPHRCEIYPEIRQRLIELPTGPALASTGRTVASFPTPVEDLPGTVRACSCGRTWVAYRLPPQAGYAAGFNLRWRPEGRLARWLRERRTRRDHSAVGGKPEGRQ